MREAETREVEIKMDEEELALVSILVSAGNVYGVRAENAKEIETEHSGEMAGEVKQ